MNNEMEISASSNTGSQKISFSHRIQNFSAHLRRGVYISPKYYSKLTDCCWILVLELARESYFTSSNWPPFFDYIRISLNRADYKKEYQSVNVHLSIVDLFNIYPFEASKEIHFTPSLNKVCVLREDIHNLVSGYFGLNTLRYMPNNVLTVNCEITVSEKVERKLTNAAESESLLTDMIVNAFEWLFKGILKTVDIVVEIATILHIISYIPNMGIDKDFLPYIIVALWYFIKFLVAHK